MPPKKKRKKSNEDQVDLVSVEKAVLNALNGLKEEILEGVKDHLTEPMGELKNSIVDNEKEIDYTQERLRKFIETIEGDLKDIYEKMKKMEEELKAEIIDEKDIVEIHRNDRKLGDTLEDILKRLDDIESKLR